MRAVPAVVALGVVLALAGVVTAVTKSEPRLAGTNDFRTFLEIPVPAGQELCQGPEFVPGDAARLRVFVTGIAAGPPLAVELRDGGRVLARGRAPGGYGGGALVVSLDAVAAPGVIDRVCLENLGDAAVPLGGEVVPPDQAARTDDARADGRVRFDWLRPGRESWLELLPTIAHRFGFGRSDLLGTWSLFLAGLLVLLSWIAALWLVLRWRRA